MRLVQQLNDRPNGICPCDDMSEATPLKKQGQAQKNDILVERHRIIDNCSHKYEGKEVLLWQEQCLCGSRK